jgi:hypothetical protein
MNLQNVDIISDRFLAASETLVTPHTAFFTISELSTLPP